MKSNYDRVFLPRRQYSYNQAEEGKWTDFIKERFKKEISFHFDDIRLDAISPEVGELLSLFEKEKGFKPFSYLQGRYKYSKSKPNPFKFFRFSVKDGGSGQGLRMVSDINFENQMACDYPANPIMICDNEGCGRWKKQVAPFRLEKKPGRKIPVGDFFDFWAGPRRPDLRIYGISAKAREAILQYNITGCETQPILSHEGEALSNICQLTITGETYGAFPTEERLSDLTSCSICGYTPPLNWFELFHSAPSIILDSFFSEKDLQICDRILVEGKELRGFALSPLLFASAKFIQMYNECGLKGLSIGPVSLLSEVQAAGLMDESAFPVMKTNL
jgi:hypothetical protein